MKKSLINYNIEGNGFQKRIIRDLEHPEVVFVDGLEHWGNTSRDFVLNLFRYDNMPYCIYPDGTLSFAAFGIDECGQIFIPGN